MQAQKAALALLIIAISAVAAGVKCNVCGDRITGRYIKAEGKAFCSETCYEKQLPKCAVCKKPVKGRFIKSEDNLFCSQACFNKSLPKCTICERPVRRAVLIDGQVFCKPCSERPACFTCGMPVGRGVKLEDDRVLCQECSGGAVHELREAKDLYRRALKNVIAVTGWNAPSVPPLKLVSLAEMKKLSPDTRSVDNNLILRGLYRRKETTTTRKNMLGMTLKEEKKVSETVYILYALPQQAFITTASHELTHDLLSERFPEIDNAPLWVEEGICQYIAAIVCRRNGFAENLKSIETCQDKSYGDGYRFFRSHAGKDNWAKVVQWIQTTDLDKLPDDPPEK